MNTRMKFRSTLLAAAVALACGSTVAAEDEAGNMDTQTSDQYQTQTEPSYESTDQTQQPYPETEPTDSTTEPTDSSEPYGDEMAGQEEMTPEGQTQIPPTTTPDSQTQDPQWSQDQDSTASDSSQAQGSQDSQWNQDQTSMASQGKGKEVFTEEFASENELGEFVKAIEAAGLGDALADGTEYTIFAPTDEAFASFKEEKGEDWSPEQNQDELTEILRSHVVVGNLDREQVKALDKAQVLTGSEVQISAENDELKIGDAKVVDEVELTTADNITIYTIDKVIDPTTLEQSASTSEQQDSATSSPSESGYSESESEYESEYEEEDEAAE